MRQILGVYSAPRPHWVGDGFHVSSVISPQTHGQQLSPFILLDHGTPVNFGPVKHRRGVGQHPHKGFETVTIVYAGEVEHRDSTGAGGVIGPGDVQWMTAASGIVHEEFHSREFARTGGQMEMVQLWVNLPAKDKNADPGYQSLLNADIPVVDLPEQAGSLRVIAGAYGGQKGPARTFTPIDIWDVTLRRDRTASFSTTEGHTLAVVVLSGTVQVNDTEVLRAGQLAVLARTGGAFTVEANAEAKFLVLAGEPIDEPVFAYGPFVMNTREEVTQAMADFQAGRFGRVAEPAE